MLLSDAFIYYNDIKILNKYIDYHQDFVETFNRNTYINFGISSILYKNQKNIDFCKVNHSNVKKYLNFLKLIELF